MFTMCVYRFSFAKGSTGRGLLTVLDPRRVASSREGELRKLLCKLIVPMLFIITLADGCCVPDHLTWNIFVKAISQILSKASRRFQNTDPALAGHLKLLDQAKAAVADGVTVYHARDLNRFCVRLHEAFPDLDKVNALKTMLETVKAAKPSVDETGLKVLRLDVKSDKRLAELEKLLATYQRHMDCLFGLAAMVADTGAHPSTWCEHVFTTFKELRYTTDAKLKECVGVQGLHLKISEHAISRVILF